MILNFQQQLTWKNCCGWFFLWGLSSFYRIIYYCWILLYFLSIKKSYRSQKPVISVGNITVGGTGKTPMIDWLLHYASQCHLKAAVLTRGYKSKHQQPILKLNQTIAPEITQIHTGDEPWLLSSKHPETDIYIGRYRVLSAQLAEKQAELLLLDDGMQHRSLQRDLNIVLVDTITGIGNGHLIPLGPLREPLKALQRADIIIYTKTNLKPSDDIRKKIQPYLRPKTPQFDSKYLPSTLLNVHSNEFSPSILAQQKCALISGIANPKNFQITIEKLGGIVQEHLIFSDHQLYEEQEVEKIQQLFKKNDFVITTEKDWTKLSNYKKSLLNLYRLSMNMFLPEDFPQYLQNAYPFFNR